MKELLLVVVVVVTVVALSTGALAAKQVRTTKPVSSAYKATLNYGQEQSDWGQAKVNGCHQEATANGGLNILCTGKTRILGPGGGGDLKVDYSCHFLFVRESATTYVEVKRICD